MLRELDLKAASFDADLEDLLRRDVEFDESVESTCRDIIDRIRNEGDGALLDLTRRLDHMDCGSVAELEISSAELDSAVAALDEEVRGALEKAVERIRAFHEKEITQSWEYEESDGTRLGQIVTPLERVGIYVPGGKAAYPSSVLMSAVPAKVAGVDEVIMVVPTPDNQVEPAVLAAARLGGVDRVFRIGGAQAVAALAYGTASVPRVDKIVGPGNIYVATAKKLVFGRVGIDMIAGPSEVVVIADEKADPTWVAMDLFAQAEHDELAQSILIAPDQGLIDAVKRSMSDLLPTMSRRSIIETALAGQGAVIKVESLEQAVDVANRIAPEHLELMVADPKPLLPGIRNAGAVFAGYFSAESLGDYCAGPNHVLPTSGTARFSSPLGVYDFQKRTSLIQCSVHGASKLARTASVLARTERLTAHANSAEYRF